MKQSPTVLSHCKNKTYKLKRSICHSFTCLDLERKQQHRHTNNSVNVFWLPKITFFLLNLNTVCIRFGHYVQLRVFSANANVTSFVGCLHFWADTYKTSRGEVLSVTGRMTSFEIHCVLKIMYHNFWTVLPKASFDSIFLLAMIFLCCSLT